MYNLVIKPFAETDATNAANWYNDKREGLGEEFLLTLEAKFSAIQRNPNQFQVIYKGIRRALTERFRMGFFIFAKTKPSIFWQLFILAGVQNLGRRLDNHLTNSVG